MVPVKPYMLNIWPMASPSICWVGIRCNIETGRKKHTIVHSNTIPMFIHMANSAFQIQYQHPYISIYNVIKGFNRRLFSGLLSRGVLFLPIVFQHWYLVWNKLHGKYRNIFSAGIALINKMIVFYFFLTYFQGYQTRI